MKRLGWVVALMLVAAGNAGAAEIAGKWGIGAALFNTGFESSLIHAHSNRTAWVFDVSLAGSSVDRTDEVTGQPTAETKSKVWSVNVGPAMRRFLRPSSEFSPYGDLFVSFGYAHQHDDGGTVAPTVTTTNPSVSTGLAFGLEYFTRWNFSVAADTEVLRLGWNRFRQEAQGPLGGGSGRATDENFFTSVGLAPRLILRAYF